MGPISTVVELPLLVVKVLSRGVARRTQLPKHYPKAREVLDCDFRGLENPEMCKRRPVVILSYSSARPGLDISGPGRQIQSTRAFHSTGVHLISALKLSNKPRPPPNLVAVKRNAPCGASGQRCYRWRGTVIIRCGNNVVKQLPRARHLRCGVFRDARRHERNGVGRVRGRDRAPRRTV